MKKFIRPVIIAAAFIVSAVVYSCGNKSEVELPLDGSTQTESTVIEGSVDGTGNDALPKDGMDTGNTAAVTMGNVQNQNAGLNNGLAEGQIYNSGTSSPDISGEGMMGALTSDSTIFVHVCGAVKEPDVYELKRDARVFDAVKQAGGFADDADSDYLNLAGGVVDGQKLYIPTEQEVADGLVPAPQMNTVSAVGTDVSAAAGITSGEALTGSSDVSGKVNINTATAEELKTLNGIGDKRASDIINYRDANGGFKSIEDIKKVDGIKDGIYSKIKDYITI